MMRESCCRCRYNDTNPGPCAENRHHRKEHLDLFVTTAECQLPPKNQNVGTVMEVDETCDQQTSQISTTYFGFKWQCRPTIRLWLLATTLEFSSKDKVTKLQALPFSSIKLEHAQGWPLK